MFSCFLIIWKYILATLPLRIVRRKACWNGTAFSLANQANVQFYSIMEIQGKLFKLFKGNLWLNNDWTEINLRVNYMTVILLHISLNIIFIFYFYLLNICQLTLIVYIVIHNSSLLISQYWLKNTLSVLCACLLGNF